ncbi:MAG: tRNA (N6-isopentenyl adenosine(37)-C2)-methylthiotransferase MiaB [Bacteroidetes bacterium GWF2_43_63]|nr:MAG: tRNA (N6-isopentenyl adenosine(37)-C2)-methylthiotransferase MiaB [Bacteroidetes bacterium GWE2_42_42]OFY55536.1 MAG: tRNA (N6-isopentenyl adenosine(37)-C2)-methylthiotransferase MiaB [Bacteroidetes bacterium GWF2_43_63]HBG71546.1 tRNA (N6-isopentenyl adenosine(37)-C2)-methylthiotransferase MiaB [Bacteroidales bacterium]HCB62079.1 tRNA (N6-isopentenyl adenosine(37)-C2)-methylthiotransferase MiaB [Bacteroidales bacterium]HCY22307.1 tRNA (N6-isopentenyl adenosine(37)-C2)-methylthiotransfe
MNVKRKKLYIETYGCQMNVADSEVVASILKDEGYDVCTDAAGADLILVNTCSIRDNAEKKVLARGRQLQALKRKNPNLRVGIIGCMAERLNETIFEKLAGVDLLAGPDSYKKLPELLKEVESHQKASDVILSTTETYEDIDPEHFQTGSITAFVSIMRGCNNFCSYCVVPYTRGRERSRPASSIMHEIKLLAEQNFKEITLLGQNVNSYHVIEDSTEYRFPALLDKVAKEFPMMRIRFATSHPKDLSEELVKIMAKNDNICKSMHLPVQSGSDAVLQRMNRKYTSAEYLKKIDLLRKHMPDITISTDVITGFCGETDEDHLATIELMKKADFYYAYMFKYSKRDGTAAAKMQDDVPEETKSERLTEIIKVQQELSLQNNKRDIGKTFEVLVEGCSKRSKKQMFGRTGQNKVVVFDAENLIPGTFVKTIITDCSTATLKGKIV